MVQFIIAIILFVLPSVCKAWASPPSYTKRQFASAGPGSFILQSSTTADGDSGPLVTVDQQNVEDEDEYEYVELEMLTETDFLGSEWLVGTVFDSNKNTIKETWCRLVVNEKGKNIAVWGDDGTGTWNFDVASQFLSFSKDTLWGKNIWAGVVDDFYYLQGTVRGWSFLLPASVVGQWQARRLGVDEDEAGEAPWFITSQDGDELSANQEQERLSQGKLDPDDMDPNTRSLQGEEGR
jgi:hypothetical protein